MTLLGIDDGAAIIGLTADEYAVLTRPTELAGWLDALVSAHADIGEALEAYRQVDGPGWVFIVPLSLIDRLSGGLPAHPIDASFLATLYEAKHAAR